MWYFVIGGIINEVDGVLVEDDQFLKTEQWWIAVTKVSQAASKGREVHLTNYPIMVDESEYKDAQEARI
jgi:hypothetical protein